jgi:hypothetical protein
MPTTLATTRAVAPASYTRAELMALPDVDLPELYRDAVGMLRSYIGGDGGLEHGLWATVELIQKVGRKRGLGLAEVDDVEVNQSDWM